MSPIPAEVAKVAITLGAILAIPYLNAIFSIITFSFRVYAFSINDISVILNIISSSSFSSLFDKDQQLLSDALEHEEFVQ